MKKTLVIALGMGLVSSVAWADGIILSGTQTLMGNGFGNDPRALSIQAHGPKTLSEPGAGNAPGTSSIVEGSGGCGSGDALGLVGGKRGTAG